MRYGDVVLFFFNDTAPTEIYTLSLHDALPISRLEPSLQALLDAVASGRDTVGALAGSSPDQADAALVGLTELELRGLVRRRSEEHTSELQSRQYLVCRLLLEKKK